MGEYMNRTKNVRPRTRGVKKLTAAAAVGAVALGGVVLMPTAAQAATEGVGIGSSFDSALGFHGSYRVNGVVVYCAQPNNPHPIGQVEGPGTYVTNYNGVSGNQLAGLNRVITESGATGDPDTAAALAYAIKYVVDPAGLNAHMVSDTGYPNSGFFPAGDLAKYIEWRHTGTANWQSIANQANSFVNTINSTAAGTGVAGSGSLVFTVDGGNNYDGTVRMQGTAGSTGTITLTNGFFDDNNNGVRDAGESSSKSGATADTTYHVYGIAPESGADYKISGTGQFTPPGTSGYAAEVLLFDGSNQDLIGAGRMASSPPFQVSGEDPTVRGTQFLPVLGTEAPMFLDKGDVFSDTVNFSTVADDNGTNNPFFQGSSGNYAPVTANGTVYGPFATAPDESEEVPEDAPVAGTATITTDLATGPTVSYTAVAEDAAAVTSGYYTWVWEIDWNNQDPRTQRVIPGPSVGNEDQEPYYFRDAFGQVIETSFVEAGITISTEVVSPTIALSGLSLDNVTVTLDEGDVWPVDRDSVDVPLALQGDAYFVPGTEAPAQVPAGEIPAEAQHLGTVTTEVTSAGTTTPEGILAPRSGQGYITWVWSSTDAIQGEGAEYFTDFTDDFGVPSETQEILQPEVSTKAQPGAKPGETILDTAIVEGTLPDTGAHLTFDAYTVPLVKDETTGAWVIDYPEDVEPGDLTWVCTEENLVFTDEQQFITEPGEYNSNTTTVDGGAKVLWVETLLTTPDEEGTQDVLAQGECGIPEETTFVVDVTTQAQVNDEDANTAEYGDTIKDTAVVTGYVPENGTVEFEVYVTDGAEICDASTLRTTLPAVTEVTGGYYDAENPLLVESADLPHDIIDGGTLFFVEVTKDELGREVSRGDCGEPNETVKLAGQKGATAINAGAEWAIGGAGAALLLLVGGGLLVASRRKNKADEA